jgi:hypothetical protein
MKVEQPISRRRILTVGGVALLGGIAAGRRPAAADPAGTVRLATERNYRPLAASGTGRARITRVPDDGTNHARVEAVLDRHWVDENGELIVVVRAQVGDEWIGRRRVLRTVVVGDNGDLRMETVGPDTRIEHPAFELEIALGRSHPIRDWNLIHERIFALRVSLNIQDASDFAVSDDFLFKVRRV